MTAVASASTTPHRTLLDALIASFAEARRVPNDVSEPAVILWPDPEHQWQPLVSRLRESFPFVYTLGAYAPDTGTGPAIWLRCIADRTLPNVSPSLDTVPVFYLPGVSRQVLRAGAECPVELQPLIELQYRGTVWHQKNGRDWTVEAFVGSRQGLGLEMAQDARTREALLRTLSIVADADLTPLRDRRLEAEHFDALAVDDPVRDLLRWMNDPDGTRRALDAVRWQALCSRARATFDFDPASDSALDAADRLARADSRWNSIWRRFVENPRLYPAIPALLRQADVESGELALDSSRRPKANDDAEASVRVALDGIQELPHHEACARVLELERTHGHRRDYVWAQLSESPLAAVLAPLARVASMSGSPLAGMTLDAVASAYAKDGWRCDAAAIEALASVARPADAHIIGGVVRALYLPWLDSSARHFQEIAAREVGRLHALAGTVVPDADTCVLFADGLRFDVAAALQSLLETRGFLSRLSHRIAAIPTATPTAKPVASPAADALTGSADPVDFTPVFRATQQMCTAQRLRDEISRRDIVVLDADEVRLPSGAGGGWTEAGQLDELGHKLGVRLADELSREVERLAERIATLIESGWQQVRVVTDHGWLLMPGGLPKVAMPKSVAATKWARCAVVTGESVTEMPVWPWYWDPQVRIACPPGVASFVAGREYAHGGISPQESVIPELVVERGIQPVHATIVDVTWTRLRCRTTVHDAALGYMVDIRTNGKDPRTSIVGSPKAPDAAGLVSLVVPDDEYEGAAAIVVLLDASGSVVAKRVTTVGESQ
ncbi:MAG: BREX-1 system phosphatase PglZ type B [Gemmatimonadaceae bacterium]|nr:BREX-1 system phosphatase PglZ type B [Gemmatimonadaceae bacterium]